MATSPEITAEAVRRNLISRVEAFRCRTGMSLAAVSQAAVSDHKFLRRVESGENFTVNTYQKVLDWIDEQEAARCDEQGAAA